MRRSAFLFSNLWSAAAALLPGLAIAAQEPAPEPAPRFEVERRHPGESVDAGFGFAVAALGDVDRDGTPDYAVGAPRDRSRPESDGSVTVFSGRTGRALYLHRGPQHGAAFGFAVAGLDANGDGWADVVVGAPYADLEETLDLGSVYVFSGKDGRLLRQLWGKVESDGYGWSLAPLAGDGDSGADRLAVSAPYADHDPLHGKGNDAGCVLVLALRTGSEILTVWGERAEDRCGWSMAPRPGRRGIDLLIGCEGATREEERPGSAILVRGRDGQRLQRVLGEGGDYFGAAVCAVGDIDGDRDPDFAVGAWNAQAAAGGDRTGSVSLISARTGKVLWRRAGDSRQDHFGRALACVGDLDGDGAADLAVGAPGVDDPGYVRVVSSATGATLLTVPGSRHGDRFGSALAAVDLDADGAPELIVGCPRARPDREVSGEAVVLSLR